MKSPSPDDAALDALTQKLDQASLLRVSSEQNAPLNTRGMSVGMRLVSEFVAAIIVGCAFGVGGDFLLKSSPWGLLIGLGLGFAAGVVSIIRQAKAMSKDVPIGQDLPQDASQDDDA